MTVIQDGSAKTLADINLAKLYRCHWQKAGRRSKTAADWDKRAERLMGRSVTDEYSQTFIKNINLSECRSVLDVGCGAGNITLPLAAKLETVYGLDYSAKMLEVLMANAKQAQLKNVTPIQASWYDSWASIPRCDLVVASRSTMVDDIEAALLKLSQQAKKRVYLSYLADGSFIDASLLRALGLHGRLMPSFVYLVGILHQLGFYPRVNYITTPPRLAASHNFTSFASLAEQELGPFSPEQRTKLRRWYDKNPEKAHAGGEPVRWALISWEIQA